VGFTLRFINPAWAGNHIVEAELSITDDDLRDFNIVISANYNDAHKKAHLVKMSERDYNALYNTQH